LAAIRAAGEPLKLADLARKPITPEQNAATYLRQAEAEVNAMDGTVWVGNWFGGNWTGDCPMPPEGAKLVKAAFDSHPGVMPLMERAAACPDYDVQLDLATPPEHFVDRLALPALMKLRVAARILHLRALQLAAEGHSDEAARAALVLLRLGRHAGRDCGLVGVLIQATIRGLAIDGANAALQTGPVSNEIRGALDAELARPELWESYRQAVLSERVFGMARLAQMPCRNLWLLARGSWNRQESQYLDMMQASLKLLDGPINYRQALQTTDNAVAGWQSPLCTLLAPAIKGVITARVQSQAMVRSLRVLNALQTHVPQGSDKIPKLSELGLPAETTIDPFNGEPLHVKRLPNGWLVYSVGRDLKDDGGDLEHYRDVGVGPPRPAAIRR